MTGLKSYWNVIRWRMFAFILPFVVANVSKSTRALEWSLGISALRIQYFSTGMAFGSTFIDVWKVRSNIKHCWSNDSNQRNRDRMRIWHAAKILHLPWPLHWAFHLRLMLLVIQDTLLSIFFLTNVYKRVQENRWQHLADLTTINLHRNNSMLWKYYFSFVSSSVCPASVLAD